MADKDPEILRKAKTLSYAKGCQEEGANKEFSKSSNVFLVTCLQRLYKGDQGRFQKFSGVM